MSHPVCFPVDQRFAIDWVDTIDLLVDVYSVQVFDSIKHYFHLHEFVPATCFDSFLFYVRAFPDIGRVCFRKQSREIYPENGL